MMNVLLGKRIKRIKEIEKEKELWFDNEVYVLVAQEPNRWVFQCMTGTYVVNDRQLEQHLKEGIFEIKNIAF